jgi:MEMO1 family protein
MDDNLVPPLRHLHVRPFNSDGRDLLILQDPLELAEGSVLLPRALGPLLALCDGRKDIESLKSALLLRYRRQVTTELLQDFVRIADDAYLFNNDRFRAARQAAIASYRSQPFRSPSLAGGGYPADAAGLSAYLDGFLPTEVLDPSDPGLSGIVSPHIDYPRGGTVYGKTWQAASAAINAADLAIIVGTDHNGSPGALTLTRQNYATPYGVLPAPFALVDTLSAAVHPSFAFAEELHHRNEHSIELAAVWLHFIRQGKPIEMLPILCGSFAHFVASTNGAGSPRSDTVLAKFVATLREQIAGRRVFVVAAADLSHVGPEFDGPPQRTAEQAALAESDGEVIAALCTAGAEGFFDSVKTIGDRTNICGLSPIYVAMRILGDVRGEALAYAQCPADDAGTSWVSISGVLWRPTA